MLDLLLIADDLTGAADAGVMFCPCQRPVLLLTGTQLPRPSGMAAAVLAVSTESRALAAEAAYQRLRDCLAQWSPTLTPKRLFKKIDSSLRGNIGAETDAIIAETGATVSFIAAAFPALGRTTRQGIHAIHGVPVAETELSRDPVTPVRNSNITAVVAGQSRHRVGHLSVEQLELPAARLRAQLAGLRSQGCVHITFDATCEAHLETLVDLAESCDEQVLLVGTAGLAEVVARSWRPTARPAPRPHARVAGGPPLYVCGTAAARTRQQIDALVAAGTCAVLDLPPEWLAAPARRTERLARAASLLQAHPNQALALRVCAQPDGSANPPASWPPEAIAGGLAALTRQLVTLRPPAGLFCCGGDTARAVLQAVDAWGSELQRTVRPGTVLGTLRGGPLDGILLATKPGSFGELDDLVALHNFWTPQGKDTPLP